MRTSLTQKEIFDLLDDGTPESTRLALENYEQYELHMEKIKEYPMKTVANAFKKLATKQKQSIFSVITPEDMKYFTAELSYESLQEMIQLILSMKIDLVEEVTEEAFQTLLDYLEETDNTVVLARKKELLIGLCNSIQEEGCLRSIMNQFEQTDPDLAARLKSTLVSETILMETEDRGIQRWLREVDNTNLAIFVKYCDSKLKAKIMNNLSKRLGEMLEEDISCMGQYNQESINKSKNRLFTIYRMLTEAGEIIHPYAVI